MPIFELNPYVCWLIMLPSLLQGQHYKISKPYTISVLHLMPLTGYAPRTAYECRAASEIAVNAVNNLNYILPDYQVELIVEDEFSDGVKSVANTFKYITQFDQRTKMTGGNNATTLFMSPALVAGYYSGGCKSLGAALHHMNMVAFSIGCSSKLLTDRTRYPNLYLVRGTGAVSALGQVNFMTKQVGWKQVAILGYLGNVNDNANAQYMAGIAAQNNVKVVFFDSLLDFDLEDPIVAESLNNSGARIVSVWGPQNFALKFLCYAHKFGLKGSRFVFLVLMAGLAEMSSIPDTVLPGCKKSVLFEQYKNTFGFGQPMLPFTDDSPISALGYNVTEFDGMFDRLTNSTRGLDYNYRFECHDATLELLVTLDEAEKSMKRSGSNFTLRSYGQFPREVVKFVNDSAINLDTMALRLGRVKFSPSGEPGTDVVAMAYIDRTGKMKYYGVIRQLENTTGDKIGDYKADMWMPIKWGTLNGKPPRDSAQRYSILYKVPFSVTAVVASLVGLSSIGNVMGIVVSLKKATTKCEKYWKCISSVGCIILNMSAVLFAIDADFRVWSVRIWFLVIGMAFINGALFGRVHDIRCKYLTLVQAKLRASSRISNQPLSKSLGSRNKSGQSRRLSSTISYQTDEHDLRDITSISTTKSNKVLIFGFIMANIIVVTAWLSVDPISCFITSKATRYQYEEDAYYESIATICYSRYQQAWQFSIAAAHALTLAVACFYCNELKTRHAQRAISELSWMTAGVSNSTIMLGASILILIGLADQANQTIAVAFISLMMSSITSATVNVPAFTNPLL